MEIGLIFYGIIGHRVVNYSTIFLFLPRFDLFSDFAKV